MRKRLGWFIDTALFRHFKTEINAENRVAIGLLAIGGLPISAGILITQLVVTQGGPAYLYSFALIAYFLLMLVFERRVLPADYPHAAVALYLLEAPVMLMSVLLGTVLDPDHSAVTILLFTLVMPAFVLDYPWRSLLIQGSWSALFIAVCALTKPPELWHNDAAHMFMFFMGASVLTNVILRIRLESLRHLEKAAYRLEHDSDSDTLNRYALQSRTGRYLGRPVTVLLADMDQFMLFNDFYGHQAGEDIMRSFTRALTECFGAADTYHYRGDEFLCVMEGTDEAACLAAIDQCRQKLDGYMLHDKKLPLTCAFGYVFGAPADDREFKEMIQLADIYAHSAKKSGPNGTKGDHYNQAHLRAGIIESNMDTHARAYEIHTLTGLPGMSYFVARSDALLGSVVDMSRKPVVGFFKLMHMRDFNSAFGYAEGDALICEAARLLLQHFSDRYVCHITAAQFGIMCYEDEVAPALERINAVLRAYKPGFPVQSKAGFARYTGSESVIFLMDRARTAHKSIKKSREDFCFYDDRMDAELHFNRYIVSHVDEAAEKGWLKVYYQPIARTVTGHVCNEEALSRWDDPEYGFLTPNRFIPVLEESDLIYKVTLHVVRQVLKDFRRKAELGTPIVPVSINLSRKDLQQRDMVAAITALVDESGFSRSLIKIEITESAFMRDAALLKGEVARFRKAGFDVWLDDFGSEYSTLNLLQEIDFDLIKIDMQFMKNLSEQGKNYIIVSDIIDMARRMGITTLIEGVETQAQYDIMQRLGCEKIQGYLFNRPDPLDYILERARKGTGLTFENPEDAPYYEAVGRVDLSAPMSRENSDILDQSQVACGIMEYQAGTFRCLRCTEHFRPLTRQWRKAGEEGAACALPGPFEQAARQCVADSGWFSFVMPSEDGRRCNVHMRQISHQGDRAALLTVLLNHRAAL